MNTSGQTEEPRATGAAPASRAPCARMDDDQPPPASSAGPALPAPAPAPTAGILGEDVNAWPSTTWSPVAVAVQAPCSSQLQQLGPLYSSASQGLLRGSEVEDLYPEHHGDYVPNFFSPLLRSHQYPLEVRAPAHGQFRDN